MKLLYSILLIMLFTYIGNAQSPDMIARAYFNEALADYGSRNYSSAISKLDKTEKTLGSTNPKILNLKVKCLFEMGRFERAKETVQMFFDIANSETSSALKNETLSYIVKIDEGIEDEIRRKEEAKRAKERKEEEARLVKIKAEEEAKREKERNEKRAKKLEILKEKAESGDAEAQHSYAYFLDLYLDDDEEAFKWEEKSAKQGNAQAKYSLALKYLIGVGVEENEEKGRYWLEQAANDGVVNAIGPLAENYYHGFSGFRKNWTKAYYWYDKCISQGGHISSDVDRTFKKLKEEKPERQRYYQKFINGEYEFRHLRDEMHKRQMQQKNFAIIPYYDFEKKLFTGYINPEGDFVILFEKGFSEARMFSNGYAALHYWYKGGGGSGFFIDKTGEIQFDGRKFGYVLPFQEGLAMVQSKSGEKIGFINTNGEQAIPAIYEYGSFSSEGFKEGLCAVNYMGKWGFIDKSGNEVIPFKYRYAYAFNNGKAKVKVGKNRWIYIDKNGNKVSN